MPKTKPYVLSFNSSMLKHSFLVFVFLSIALSSFAQKDTLETSKKKQSRFEPNETVMIVPNYTAQFPFASMKQRFGFNSLFSGQVLYKNKKNWLFGGEGGVLYGTDVKESYIISGIATSYGQFITQQNGITGISLGELGFNIKFTFGKIIPFSEKYPDAGLILMTEAGFLEHKISINVKASELPQFSPDYKKGYDRLSNGPVISQFVGGTFMARRKYLSFYGGLQLDAAYTQGRRPYDFYLMAPLHDNRLDLFLGIKIGYIIPIFLQTSEKEFFYY